MKMKSQFAIAGLIFAGLLASGCSQQQSAGSQQTQTAEPPKEVVTPPPAVVRPPVQQAPVMPKVKAKGNYKGPVAMDPASKGVMQQYQK